jgi:hypothetical protein
MRIDIHISDATPEELEAIAKALNVKPQELQKSNPVVQKSRPPLQKSKPKKKKRIWSDEALKMANIRTPEAPYGYRMDGTPRKPTGLQKKEK